MRLARALFAPYAERIGVTLGLWAALAGSAAPLGWTAWRVTAVLCDHKPPPLAAMVGVALMMAVSAGVFAPPAEPAPLGLMLGWALLVLAASDLADLRLPDLVTVPLLVAGLVAAAIFARYAVFDRLIGAAAGYGALAGLSAGYRRLRRREGLGLGDAKLAACAGAWLGWSALPVVILLACAITFAWIVARLMCRRAPGQGEPIAFGAPLALAIWIVWLAPADLWINLSGDALAAR